jgi:uracil-DNA glycosylase
LNNIFIELANSVEGFEIPDEGDLTGWAKQGVLLLNTALTTIEGLAGAHEQIWFGVIRKTLKEVTENRPNAVVLLWGKQAGCVRPFIGNLHSLACAHPSPMSAKRGFFGCNHFNLANEYLISKGEGPINWSYFE